MVEVKRPEINSTDFEIDVVELETETPEDDFEIDVEEPEKDPDLEGLVERVRDFLKDYLEGHVSSDTYEPDAQTKLNRAKKVGLTKLKYLAKFFGAHLLLDVPAYLAQKFHFKPEERKRLMSGLETTGTANEQLSELKRRIEESPDVDNAGKIKLLQELNELSDQELTRLEWDAMVESTLVGDDSLGEDKRIDMDFKIKVEELIKKHIDSHIKGTSLLVDALLTVMVIKGGALIKPLGKIGSLTSAAVGYYKGAKYTVKAGGEIARNLRPLKGAAR